MVWLSVWGEHCIRLRDRPSSGLGTARGSINKHQHLFFYSSGSIVHSALWHCWVGSRKGIRPVQNWVVGCWHEMQTCIWPSWCHCRSLSLASLKSRLVLPFWYRLTQVVPDKGPLNVCVCVCYYYYYYNYYDETVTVSCLLCGERNAGRRRRGDMDHVWRATHWRRQHRSCSCSSCSSSAARQRDWWRWWWRCHNVHQLIDSWAAAGSITDDARR